ncbi:VIT family-domain-containing protein [Apodospora peruviana]|uniref:VIT family-domain-containing protein n=1 Tax=Apodospora peruviana TaxID=516989 RepID=A0AAE0LYU5_9PEZI|nr:VIT family-domain-containing protein [Apodospora peruviana]
MPQQPASGEYSPLLNNIASHPHHGSSPSAIDVPSSERAHSPSSRLRPNMINRISSSTTVNQCHPQVVGQPHIESHISNYDAVLRDIIIGFSDGLTVPFALTAGLSSLGNTKIVIMGGLAELFSGMISMGLGAYLAAASERQHWEAEHARESWEVDHVPEMERKEIYEILAGYGVSADAAAPLVRELCADKNEWVRFMMDFELRLPEPDVGRAWVSAVTMGMSYFVGGLIPMLPYFFMEEAQQALWVSVAITVVILLAFGYMKSWVTIRTKKAGVWGALQTLVVGALAAGTSYAIVRLLDSET